MNTMRAILAASDFSPCASHAVRRAALLARERNVPLHLLHVVHQDLLDELRERLATSSDLRKSVLEDAQRSLETLADEIRPLLNAAPISTIRTGDAIEEILAAADYADLLVLGAYGERPIHDALIGTIAERLLRKSRRPMLVVRQAPVVPYRKVLVAVDFSTHSFAALRFAKELAPTSELLVFHAYWWPYEGKLRRANVSDEEMNRYRQERRQQALDNMENLLEKTGTSGAHTSFTVRQGDPKALIPEKAAEQGSDLIVLGKRGRSLVDELFLGGVTHTRLPVPSATLRSCRNGHGSKHNCSPAGAHRAPEWLLHDQHCLEAGRLLALCSGAARLRYGYHTAGCAV